MNSPNSEISTNVYMYDTFTDFHKTTVFMWMNTVSVVIAD